MPIRRLLRKLRNRPLRRLTVEEAHAFWRAPDEPNQPELYAGASTARSAHLAALMRQANIPTDATVLEIGCNAGRNLAWLHGEGWTRLAGVDISSRALEVARDVFPELADVELTCGPLEDFLPALADGAFDVVVSMAVLEHVHYDSSQVLDHVARVAGRWIVTVEDEASVTTRHFPRDYRQEFESRGWVQVLEDRPPDEPELRWFVSRVFAWVTP